MASLKEYVAAGAADPRRARLAALGDFVAAMLLAVIAFPFPVMRATLPVPVFVASILITIVVTHLLYLSLCAAFGGRTPGMYLMDLGFREGAPSLTNAVVWAAATAIAFWPMMFMFSWGDPATGLAARLSGVVIASTALDQR